MIEPPLARPIVVYSIPQMTPFESRKFPTLALAASFSVWQFCRPLLPPPLWFDGVVLSGKNSATERGGNLRQRHTRKLQSLASLCPAILEHSVHSVSAHNLVQGVGSFKFHASGHCLEVAIWQCFRGLDKPSCPASLKFNKTWKMMKDLSFNPRLPDSSLCPLRHSVL